MRRGRLNIEDAPDLGERVPVAPVAFLVVNRGADQAEGLAVGSADLDVRAGPPEFAPDAIEVQRLRYVPLDVNQKAVRAALAFRCAAAASSPV